MILDDAWRQFALYDSNAIQLQSRYVKIRMWIATLGVAATFLAVAYTVVEPEETPIYSDWEFYLRLLVIVTPITISVLTAGYARMSHAAAWVTLREGAEAVKREIYRYRTRVGAYKDVGSENAGAYDVLAENLERVSFKLINSEVVQISLLPYKGSLPPKYGTAEGDDGFSEMSGEQYLEARLEDQLTYYRRKAGVFDRQASRMQWAIVVMGGTGTLLAALTFEIWIPVTVSLSTMFATVLEIRNVESTIERYSRAAMELETVKTWWSSLSAANREDIRNRQILVTKTETILQNESSGWGEEMQAIIQGLDSEESD